ncbi:hypothetical protein ACFSQU_17975 [Massilia sp. GCM10020059]|uniref:MarR family transcriptional regulator n=1 Tax=Massilia agrisoli TaxID=2892444 RepID=A0ABS8ISN8_9BURK|nr:hypothetical protein [Massilia agrisoli]MCC6071430.1 hypothetical protein [Massilia agrisoli]
MTTTTVKLLDLIAKVPMVRTVQIADRLDMPVDQADKLLRQSLQAGHIIEHEVDAPNNRKAMAYELSAQYMAANALAQPAKPVEPSHQPVAVVTDDRTTRPQTKVDRAIAYVRENGPSTSTQLHAELGLAEGVHVSSYLGTAVRDGRMLRDGNTWSLPGAGTVAPAEIPKFSTIRSVSSVSESASQQSGETAKAAAQASSTPAAFRCALWSDGTFEIQRNGATIANLLPHELDTVIETLHRVRAA